jgi:hypothetical protein
MAEPLLSGNLIFYPPSLHGATICLPAGKCPYPAFMGLGDGGLSGLSSSTGGDRRLQERNMDPVVPGRECV